MEVQTLTKEQEDVYIQKLMQLQFASLKKNIIQDLANNRSESVLYKKYSKEKVVQMLENPQKYEKELREMSGFFYLISSHYRRLVDFYATILLYNYTVVPSNINLKYDKKQFVEDYYAVINKCNKYNFAHECQEIIKIVVRDGVFFGLCYESKDSFYIKPIPAQYAKISSVEDGVYKYSFDLNYFNGKTYLLEMYGKEFIKAYEAYKGNKENGTKGDKKKRWYEPTQGICIKADMSDPYYSFAVFTSVIESIYDLEDYGLLQKAKVTNDNYHMIGAVLPLDENNAPIMDYPQAQKWFGGIQAALSGSGMGCFLSPFQLESFSFKGSNSTDRDIVSDASDQVYQKAGVNSGLFGSTNITSSAALLLSVKPDEAFAFSILKQIERYFNTKIKKMNLKNGFRIKFSQQSIFNTDEYVNRLSKAGSLGVPVKMEYASALGMSPVEIIGNAILEEELGLGIDSWNHPLISSSVQSGVDSEGGRPTSESQGKTVGDQGEKTRDQDANSSR